MADQPPTSPRNHWPTSMPSPPGGGARPPTYKRTCHIVTVNASGGQINDKSNALEEKREKKKFEKLKFRYRPPTGAPP